MYMSQLVLLQGLAELIQFNMHHYPYLFKSQEKTAKAARKQAPPKSTPVLSVRTVHPLCLPSQTPNRHPAVLLPSINMLCSLLMEFEVALVVFCFMCVWS